MIGDYRGLIETCRDRADELEISRADIDRISGLPAGYSGKLLGHGNVRKKKRMWPVSLELMLGTLGLRILLIEDPAAAARTLSLREPVNPSQQRFDNSCNSTLRIAPPPQNTDTSPAPARTHQNVLAMRGSKHAC